MQEYCAYEYKTVSLRAGRELPEVNTGRELWN
jgi:hypothetical protein